MASKTEVQRVHPSYAVFLAQSGASDEFPLSWILCSTRWKGLSCSTRLRRPTSTSSTHLCHKLESFSYRYTHIYIYMIHNAYTCLYIYMYAYARAHTHTHIYVCIYMYVYIYIHTYNTHAYPYTYRYTYNHIRIFNICTIPIAQTCHK